MVDEVGDHEEGVHRRAGLRQKRFGRGFGIKIYDKNESRLGSNV